MQPACCFQGMAPADSPELRIPDQRTALAASGPAQNMRKNRRNVNVRNANGFFLVALNFDVQII